MRLSSSEDSMRMLERTVDSFPEVAIDRDSRT
jgi:hypothetical protein